MKNSEESGFVLPYVLLVIAILSLSVTLAAQRIQTTHKLVEEIESRFYADLALSSAEAETIFSLLTSAPTEKGIDLNPKVTVQLFTQRVDTEHISDVWPATGTYRGTNTKHGTVWVSYRDTSGLVQINTKNPQLIVKLLQHLGASSGTALNLSAKLSDYIDEDNIRQFRGGERADYRLRRRLPPSNAPIRRFAELENVIEWDGFLRQHGLINVMQYATLSPTISNVKIAFADPELAKTIGTDLALSNTMDALGAQSLYPSDTGRFILHVRTPSGKEIQRAIEVEKTIGSLAKPFERDLVYEIVKSPERASQLPQIEQLKHVIHSETHRAQ